MFINLKVRLWQSDKEEINLIVNSDNINYIHEKTGAINIGTKQFYLNENELENLIIILKKL